MHKGLTMATAVAGMLMVSSAATAGGYVGIGYGSAAFTFSKTFDGTPVEANAYDAGFKFSGGVMFSDNFGVEVAGYTAGGTGVTAGDFVANMDMSGYAAFAVAKFPIHLDIIKVFGKAGMMKWEYSDFITDGTTTLSSELDGTDVIWGAGFEFKIDETLSIITGWEHLILDTSDGSDQEIDLMSATLHYNF